MVSAILASTQTFVGCVLEYSYPSVPMFSETYDIARKDGGSTTIPFLYVSDNNSLVA